MQESNERPHRATKGGCYVLIGASLQKKLWACQGEGIVHITPESKKQSLLWRRTGSRRPKIFKQTPSAHKIAAAVCCERTGVILVEFCHKGRPSVLSQWSKMNARFRYCALLNCIMYNWQGKSYILKEESYLLVFTHNESMLCVFKNWKNVFKLHKQFDRQWCIFINTKEMFQISNASTGHRFVLIYLPN